MVPCLVHVSFRVVVFSGYMLVAGFLGPMLDIFLVFPEMSTLSSIVHAKSLQFSSVQSLSHVRLLATP